MIEFLFFISLAAIFYTYVGYPIHLFLMAKLSPRPIDKNAAPGFQPSVSVVIAARNEESNIGRRILNLAEEDYPADRMEIIIVSDGSTDKTTGEVERLTAQIGQGRPNPQIKMLAYAESKGKPYALNLGVAASSGEIIIFADSRQTFEPDAIKHLVANFIDPSVGCVSGELVFVDNRETGLHAEMGAYWRYEKLIRKAESRSGSVVGATGAIYAIRRKLYLALPEETLLDDVLTPLNIACSGYRVLFDGSAVATDVVSKDVGQEWRRKVRTLAGNWQLLTLKRELLNPSMNPLWWRLLAHKLLRLVMPVFLPVLFFTGASMAGVLPRIFTDAQIVFYLLALTGLLFESARRHRTVNLAYFFVILNCAAAAGFVRWATGQCASSWRMGHSGQGADA